MTFICKLLHIALYFYKICSAVILYREIMKKLQLLDGQNYLRSGGSKDKASQDSNGYLRYLEILW